MKNRDPSQQLLDDIFVDAISPEFRSGLLADTLRQVRQKRRSRKMAQSVAILATLALIALSSRQFKAPAASQAAPRRVEIQLVDTRPLATGSIVHTRPFAVDRLVETVAFSAQVQTTNAHLPVRLINDRELLAFAGEGQAILVRVGPDQQELIFVNPEDAKRLSPR